jgi:hypothetical protein
MIKDGIWGVNESLFRKLALLRHPATPEIRLPAHRDETIIIEIVFI